ncbi:HAD domain-containing protein [Streptomyces sp. NPDC058274]|uniref:HAD domain-containing protein n=1 Tax=Streptomyces sp. NPDC058274 TaxID=3346416 RepID=UPI0036E95021
MPDPSQRPLLFLDVDGPLIPFGASPQHQTAGYRTYPSALDLSETHANPLLARIDPAHGPKLAALPCDLLWATTWAEEANDCIAPRLGLPPLPVVEWPEPSEDDERDVRSGLHWKTRALVGWAAGRAFVWVDDEITDRDRDWVAARHGRSALLHRVDPRRGLTDADYVRLADWLRAL